MTANADGRRTLGGLLACALLVGLLVPGPATAAERSYLASVDISFPVHGPAHFEDDYEACRDGCNRKHLATDLMAEEGTPVHAAMGGVVTWITGIDEPVPSYGYMITIAGDDGREYSYVHLGRQNRSWKRAYVRGVVLGAHIQRGQHIGWVGCSGNASCSAPHLHFEIEDPAVEDPYGGNRVNPYRSLVDALESTGLPGFHDVNGRSRHYTNIELVTDTGILRRCRKDDTRFCPKRDMKVKHVSRALARGLELPVSSLELLGRWDPDRVVTRGLVARAIARNLGLEPVAGDHLDDLDSTKKSHRLMYAVVEAGIMPPCRGGAAFCRRRVVDKRQLATYVARAVLGSRY